MCQVPSFLSTTPRREGGGGGEGGTEGWECEKK